MSQLEQWFENTFKPWQAEMKAQKSQKEEQIARMQQNPHVMQQIIAAVLEGKSREAVTLWNRLGLVPALADVKLNYAQDAIILRRKDGKAMSMPVDTLLAELEELF